MRRKMNSPITIMQTNPKSDISERYRNLRFHLDLMMLEQGLKAITVTSSYRGEGKTTTAVNLAESIAHNGLRVLIVDCNIREPAVHHAYQLKNNYGLSNYLVGEQEAVIHSTHIDHLFVITAGSVPENIPELFNIHKLYAFMDDLKKEYDAVIFDTPPLLQWTDAKIVAAGSDGVLLVIEHGKLKRTKAQKIQQEFELMNVNLLGVVLNKVNRRAAKMY